MPEDIVALSKRIARLKPDHDEARSKWLGDFDDKTTGLPAALGPFCITPRRGDNYTLLGGWKVTVAVKNSGGDAVVLDDLPDIFTAYRAMVDCFEAWQLIKPIERVYFIGTQLAPGRLVKVGYSRDPKARLRTLQTGHGEELQIFATALGGKELEAKYHRRWNLRRRQGEWFQIGEPIIKEIERLRALA